jgi:hypothetical protein
MPTVPRRLPLKVSVPLDVIGEPLTVSHDGFTVAATLVTVPPPDDPFAAAVILPVASTVRFVAV